MSSQPSLPFLPGYRIETDRRDNFHKSHFFEVQNGTRVDHSQSLVMNGPANAAYQATLNKHPLDISTGRTEYQDSHSEPQSTSVESLTQTMSKLPAWVAYDRKVLRFYGYFKESVHSSPVETWRVRRCVIYLYLEDESMHIAEPKIENSGIPQGVFVKRHRIPKSNSSNNSLFGVNDLKVGSEIIVYGRTFYLVDADQFTREFYSNNGEKLKPAQDYPIDPFNAKLNVEPLSTHKTMHPHKLYMEASLGKPMLPSSEQTQKFLTQDGKVLRFYASWDDDKMYGERKPYIVHYYLADDTIEINEIQTPNNGRDPFPLLLKRGKLPKNWQHSLPNVSKLGAMSNKDRFDNQNENFYSLLDLRIGNTINVYGRLLLLCSLDQFTKNYYCENFGLTENDFQPIQLEDPENEIRPKTPPPHNGYGTEEDSLGSYLFLMPKVPKTDFKKLQSFDGIHLRFGAKFASINDSNNVDANRRFILTLYCSTDQLAIFEKFERNSGFLAGKFLEKSKLKNPQTKNYFHYNDFKIGNKVTINEYVFEILEADEFTQKWIKKQSEGKRGEEEKTQF